MSFKSYYLKYLTLHTNPVNRRLHFLGNVLTLLFVVWAIAGSHWLALLITPFIIYPFAWSGHFFFEKNKPAAWSNPIKAKLCDWVMMWHMLTRRIPW